MGPARKSYERVAPPNSFIHVDDFTTPQQLAQYVQLLGTFTSLTDIIITS